MATLIGKMHNISRAGLLNMSQAGERLANLTSAAKLNGTHSKHFGQRLNTSRLLERFSSKHSLLSLASTGVSSNKTSSPKVERDSSANVTLDDMKNSTKSNNKTIEKREIRQQNSSRNNATEKGTSLTSMIHSLPDLLSNATANVTTWAKKMFSGFSNTSSTQNVTKKVSTRSVKLELSANSTNLNKTSEKASEVNSEEVEERHDSDSKSNSSLLNVDVVTIKRDVANKTLNVSSAAKHSKDSTKAKNITKTDVKHKAANLTLNATGSSLNQTKDLANVTVEAKSNGSLVKSSVEHKNRTIRSMNGNSFVGRFPNFVMGQSAGSAPVSYAPAAPASYVPAPLAPSSYGMVPPAPVYSAPATAAPVYSYSTPAYGYSSTASYVTGAPSYAMNPAAPVYRPAAAPSAPVYGPAPAAPVYGVSPAPMYPQSESYYTAPPPTSAPYNQPSSYPAQPYGSVPPRQSATESPWF